MPATEQGSDVHGVRAHGPFIAGILLILSALVVLVASLVGERVCTTHNTVVKALPSATPSVVATPHALASRTAPTPKPSGTPRATLEEVSRTDDTQCSPVSMSTGFPFLAAICGAALLLPTFMRRLPEGSSIEALGAKIHKEQKAQDKKAKKQQSAQIMEITSAVEAAEGSAERPSSGTPAT